MSRVIYRSLRLGAFVCCSLVVASFALFAVDQMAGASKHQQNELAARLPTAATVVRTVHHQTGPRQFIDSAAHALTAPFRSIVQSGSAWAQRGFQTICALLVYGLGLGYLARFSRGLA